MPVRIEGAIDLGGNVIVGPDTTVYRGRSTDYVQNTSGVDSYTGVFFRPNDPLWAHVAPGWTVSGMPGAVVTSATCDPADQYTTSVTVTGGVFVSGTSYSFVGV